MPTVNGTLKYFGPTKDGKKATLTADWDDGEKKKWVTWEEAQPLRDARLVFKSSETWDDGKPKWKVDGAPAVGIVTTFNGKVPTNTVVIGNGAAPAHDAQPDENDRPDSGAYRSVKQVARHFAYCLREAQETVWGDSNRVSAEALYKTAYTLYADADPSDTPADFSEVPAALQEEEGDDSLPF